MNKKLHLSILYVISLSLIIGGVILYSKPAEKKESKSVAIYKKIEIKVPEQTKQSEIQRKQAFKILNNIEDINLRAELIEDINGQVSLCLTYKLNGKPVTKIFETTDIPEIRNILRFREEHNSGYRINNAALNKEMQKLYFYIEGRKIKNYINTAVYSYDLKNSNVKRVYYDTANFSKFNISPDGKYNAFSFVDDAKNTRSIILRCKDDAIVLDGKLRENDSLYSYNCEFLKWESAASCLIKESVLVKDGSNKIRENTLCYNVTTNKFTE